MRTFPMVRVLVLAAALTAPFAQIALAQEEQQAMAPTESTAQGAANFGNTGPYDAPMPTVGD